MTLPGPDPKFRFVEVNAGRNRFTKLEVVQYTPREIVELGTGYVFWAADPRTLAQTATRAIDCLCRDVLWVLPTLPEMVAAQNSVVTELVKRGQSKFQWVGGSVQVPEWGTKCSFLVSGEKVDWSAIGPYSVLIVQNIDALNPEVVIHALGLLVEDSVGQGPEVIYTTPEDLRDSDDSFI